MQPRIMVGMVPTFFLGFGLTGCLDPADLGTGQRPIVRGQPTTDYPATVFLWLGGGSCSGTLVSPRTVLTAEHCMGGSPSQMEVFFGSDVDQTGTWIQVADYDTHPSVDIAMMTLAEPGPTAPIPINTADLSPHIGEPVIIVGFGVTSENGADSGLKRVGETPLDSVDDEIMWSGVSGSATCYGDSGGPNFMTVDGTLVVVGVTSFGTSVCGEPYDGATRVDTRADWIQAYIDANDPATCEADFRCVTGCQTADPDCPSEPPDDPPPDDPPPDDPPPDDPPPDDPPGGDGDGGGLGGDVSGGCSAAAPGDGASLLLALLVLGWLAARARRR